MNNQSLKGPYSIGDLKELEENLLPSREFGYYWFFVDSDLSKLVNDAMEIDPTFIVAFLKEFTSGNVKTISVEIDKKVVKLYKKFD